jgi:hypothetical protein
MVYDTGVYRYALTNGDETFNFFGRRLCENNKIARIGFAAVLIFYYATGLVLLAYGM